MSDGWELGLRAILIGTGATVTLDLWSVFLQRALGFPPTNWGMVGRWIGHLPGGRFVQTDLATAPAVPGETAIGWVAHYLIGITFATSLLLIMGLEWARHPTFLPPLVFGAVTVVFPYFVLQPGLGLGIAASKAPAPGQARLRSIAAHVVFGAGMYLSAALGAALLRQ